MREDGRLLLANDKVVRDLADVRDVEADQAVLTDFTGLPAVVLSVISNSVSDTLIVAVGFVGAGFPPVTLSVPLMPKAAWAGSEHEYA